MNTPSEPFSPNLKPSKSELKLGESKMSMKRSPSEFMESQMNYLNKRDQKIEKLRNEKIENTNRNVKAVPDILEKSKDIYDNKIKEKKEVYDRLYNEKFERDKKTALEKEFASKFIL